MKKTLPSIKMKAYGFRRQLFLLCFVMAAGFSATAQTNLALSKSVTASAPSDPVNLPLSNLTDGNTGTYTSVNPAAGGGNVDWIQIDLGSNQFLNSIEFTASGHPDRARRFLLACWSDDVAGDTGIGTIPLRYIQDSRFTRLSFSGGITGGASDQLGPSPYPGPAGQYLGPSFTNNTTFSFNTGQQKIRYIRVMNLQNDTLEFSEIKAYPAPPPVRNFTNGDFETGMTVWGYQWVRHGLVPGWSTTEPVGFYNGEYLLPTDGTYMEFWSSGFNQVPSASGSHFVELNATAPSELSQPPVCLLPGESIQFSFAHQGRAGVDTIALRVDGKDVATFADDANNPTGIHASTLLDNSGATVLTGQTTTPNGWTQYTGTYTNITPTPRIIVYGYRALSSAGGSFGVGNFLDNVSMVRLNPIITLEYVLDSGLENIPTAKLPRLFVNGEVTAPLTVQLAIDPASTATRGSDYTTPNAATGPLTITIPTGNYDGTAATAISLASDLQIATDNVANEPNETLILNLQNPSAPLIIADARACIAATATTTYIIKDQGSPLPVSWLGFEARPQGNDVVLNWQIARAEKGTRFSVEYAAEGASFKEFAALQAVEGQSAYSSRHQEAMRESAQQLYYRIRQTTASGESTYSPVRVVSKSAPATPAGIVYPNPVLAGKEVTVYGTAIREVTLTDLEGRQLWRTQAASVSELTVPTKGLAPGHYFIRINEEEARQLVVQ